MLRNLISTLLSFGPVGILMVALIDSVGIPLPGAMDFLLVAFAVKVPQQAYYSAFMAVLGSTGGNVALFMAARHGSKFFMKSDLTSPRGQKFQQWFHRYGLLTIFVPAVTPVVPFPLKVFVMSAGCLRTRFSKFLVVVLVARIIRYFGEAYLGLNLGEHAEGFLRRNAWPLLGGAVVMATGLYLLMRYSERRGESVL